MRFAGRAIGERIQGLERARLELQRPFQGCGSACRVAQRKLAVAQVAHRGCVVRPLARGLGQLPPAIDAPASLAEQIGQVALGDARGAGELHFLQEVCLSLVVEPPLHIVARPQSQEGGALAAHSVDASVEQVDRLARFVVRPIGQAKIVGCQQISRRCLEEGFVIALFLAHLSVAGCPAAREKSPAVAWHRR